MPRDKTASHARVLAAIKAEFLEKGYEKASIRSIGRRAGMAPAGLYRHYADKEAMFQAAVEPLLAEIDTWLTDHKANKYGLVDQKAEADALFGQTFVDLVKEVIYPNKDEFRMLLCCAQGTRYENFIHDFVAGQQGEMAQAICYMKTHGYPAAELKEEELHMLLSAYMTAVFEPIIHDYPKQSADHYLDTINHFFMPGWMEIMGL